MGRTLVEFQNDVYFGGQFMTSEFKMTRAKNQFITYSWEFAFVRLNFFH